MINWIAVKEASFEEMRQKWESLPKELRYAAYGGAGGSALAMLIHRLMGTDHRKGRTIGWGAIGALTGGAGGAVTGYTERKITPFVKRLLTDVNDSVKGYSDNIQEMQRTQQKLQEVAGGLENTVNNASENLTKNINDVSNNTNKVLRSSDNLIKAATYLVNGIGKGTNAAGDLMQGGVKTAKRVAKKFVN